MADVSARRLSPCALSLKPLHADGDLVKLFEEAFKQQPDNDELGRQAFFANVRAGNWKVAQLVRIFLLFSCEHCCVIGASWHWNGVLELICHS